MLIPTDLAPFPSVCEMFPCFSGQKNPKSDNGKNGSADNSQLDENAEANQPEAEISQPEKVLYSPSSFKEYTKGN